MTGVVSVPPGVRVSAQVSGLLRDIVCNQLKFQNTGRQTENMTGVVVNTISLIIFSPSESGDAAEIGAENKTGSQRDPWEHDTMII